MLFVLRRCSTAMLAVLLVVGAGGSATAGELERATQRRADLEERLDAVTTQLQTLSVQIEDAQFARERLENEVAELQSAATVADSSLAMRAVSAYKHGAPDVLTVLFDAQGPRGAVERARLMAGMGRREQVTIEQAAVARGAVGAKRAELDTLLEGMDADQAQLAALQAELDEAFEEAADREFELANRRSRQRTVSRDRQHGTYACPMRSPYTFRDTWGAPRSGGRKHKGVDMFAPMGGDVYAITAGSIARHTNSGLGGLGLYLTGDDGNSYYYAHLQDILPAYGPGRRVEAGELIARNGDTGNARGGAPHVHFQVHPGGGGPVNPYPFAAAACF